MLSPHVTLELREQPCVLGTKKALLGKKLPCRELPCSSKDKESACDAENLCLIPKSGRKIPGEGNCNPLQYSCLENPKDREVTKSQI